MIESIIRYLKHYSNNSTLESYKRIIEKINDIKLTLFQDRELLEESWELIKRAHEGISLDELLVDAFALVKEAAWRGLKLKAYDEQLMAGIAMHHGRIAEMPNGEGKTLSAVFPAYLNSLHGRGVHILAFNDYLARRDAKWMEPVFKLLGLTVGYIQQGMDKEERRKAYECDITYLTAREAGFDYLRDYMCYSKEDMVQRSFNYAIVDEADSVLIDEARNLLIIAAGTTEEDIEILTGKDALKWPGETEEGMKPQTKARILNRMTLQALILMYKKIAGISGTAMDSRKEFIDLYGIDIVEIPPHRECLRKDYPDAVFIHKKAKLKGLVEEILLVHATGQPILVGTCSARESVELAEELKKSRVDCRILNAENDELDAALIAEAGTSGAVTVAANMAGRGTDIRLGGSQEKEREKVTALGGLYVIGTSRSESRRIDKQLRGRAGRQGNPGKTRFFVSLEDELLMKYRINNIISSGGKPEKQDKPLEYPRLNKKIEEVQRIIEGRNTNIARELRKYSIVLEKQRTVINRRRLEIMESTSSLDIPKIKDPDLFYKLLKLLGQDRLSELGKNIVLCHLDEGWSDYLIKAELLQKNAYLNKIGGKKPLEVFSLKMAEEFKKLEHEIAEKTLDELRKLEINEESLVKAQERMKPHLKTWTYVIDDNSLNEKPVTMFIGMRVKVGNVLRTILTLPMIVVETYLKRGSGRSKII